MDETAITQYITNPFGDVETTTAQGYTFLFRGSDRKLPFATLATQDNEYDRASNQRPGSITASPGECPTVVGVRAKRRH